MFSAKRIFSLLLALLFTVSVFTGCSEKTPGSAEPDEDRYIYSHVVLIGVDGAGTFFRNTDTPRIDEIFADSLVTYDMLTSNPSISAQSWGAMLTGCTPEIHGFTNPNLYEKPHALDSDAPTVFRIIREQMPDAVLGSFCSWDALNYGLIEDGIDVVKGTVSDDEATAQNAADFILTEKPVFTFAEFDFVDEAGHAHGYNKQEHLAQITVTDGYIGQIYDACAEAGILDDTLFIVTADHGGEDVSHGGWLDQEKYIMFAIRGKTVVPHGTPEDAGVRDTAAIILYALGLEDHLPEKSSAHIPADVFEGVEATERREITYTYSQAFKTHETEPTPEIGSGSSVVDVLGEDRILAYYTFDRTSEDALGKMETEENGKLYYPDAFYGSGIEFDDGYISMLGFEPGTESFSACFWLKYMSNSQTPVIFGNKSFASAVNPGYALSFKYEEFLFNVGNKKKATVARFDIPEERHNVWVYAAVTVDRENNRIGVSFDFGDFLYHELDEDFRGYDYSTSMPTNIGQDGKGIYRYKTPGIYDEMVFLDGVMTNEDIAALKALYIHE